MLVNYLSRYVTFPGCHAARFVGYEFLQIVAAGADGFEAGDFRFDRGHVLPKFRLAFARGELALQVGDALWHPMQFLKHHVIPLRIAMAIRNQNRTEKKAPHRQPLLAGGSVGFGGAPIFDPLVLVVPVGVTEPVSRRKGKKTTPGGW